MKLLIEINDYEKLKNMVETLMDDKHRKTKNIDIKINCISRVNYSRAPPPPPKIRRVLNAPHKKERRWR